MQKIDWFFEHEAGYFGARLERLVLEIHRLASTQLEVVYKAELDSAEKDSSLEEDDLASLENYLKGGQPTGGVVNDGFDYVGVSDRGFFGRGA